MNSGFANWSDEELNRLCNELIKEMKERED